MALSAGVPHGMATVHATGIPSRAAGMKPASKYSWRLLLHNLEQMTRDQLEPTCTSLYTGDRGMSLAVEFSGMRARVHVNVTLAS